MKIPPTLLRYWLAMNASALQSAAHTTKAFVATATAHALQYSIPALNLTQTAAVFGLAFGLEIINWLAAHPLVDLSLTPKTTQVSEPPVAP